MKLRNLSKALPAVGVGEHWDDLRPPPVPSNFFYFFLFFCTAKRTN
nr:MAG TPA: hypothetical protein [Caudoviricetes sp.]